MFGVSCRAAINNYNFLSLCPATTGFDTVATVRYKHALRRLQAAIPSAVPELVLEPQMARKHSSIRVRMDSDGLCGSRGRCTCARWGSATIGACAAPSGVRVMTL